MSRKYFQTGGSSYLRSVWQQFDSAPSSSLVVGKYETKKVDWVKRQVGSMQVTIPAILPFSFDQGANTVAIIRNKGLKRKKTEPVWAGPEVDGVTQSLLGLFHSDRERFRLRVIHGIAEEDRFERRIEYGQMFHGCEEQSRKRKAWLTWLTSYAKRLCKKFPMDQEHIDHWYNVCKVQFPIYQSFWKKNDPKGKWRYLLHEHVFAVPYELPSGRTVILRGKWDGVAAKAKQLRLDEHKTKGDINEAQLRKQLLFDIQLGLYLVALETWAKLTGEGNVRDVKYNVIRRPLAGGKYSISRKKPTKALPDGESKKEYYDRLQQIIKDDPEWFFMRWNVSITARDIANFRAQTLNPMLEQLCQWYDVVSKAEDDPFGMVNWQNGLHYRTPYGIWDHMKQGAATPIDDYLNEGSMLGLVRNKPLFQELQDEED